MAISRGPGEGVAATLPLRAAGHGASASFLVRADDGRDYWCKAVNNPSSTRIPTNEQVVGRLATIIGVAVPELMLVDITGIAGWEFSPGRTVEPGWAHGSTPVEACVETRDLQHRTDNDNRVRHVGFYALMDWFAGGDQQWLYSGIEQNAYYSHDHGHYFPGGPNWTPAALQATSTSAVSLGVPAADLDDAEVARVADAIERVSRGEIDAELSKIPADWPVDDAQLEALAAFIEAREGPAAARLRALVP